jgi:hypothetical protein
MALRASRWRAPGSRGSGGSARIERTRNLRAVRIFLASGPTIRFTRYARNYGELITALGLSPEGG